MSTTAEELNVEVDQLIRERPTLLAATESATRFVRDFIESHPKVFGADRRLQWKFHSTDPHAAVRENVGVHYSEVDDLGGRQLSTWMPTQELLDPVGRQVRMIKLLEGILSKRWDQLDAVTKTHLQALIQEEERGSGR